MGTSPRDERMNMAGRYYSTDVLKYLEKNVRLNVYVEDIAKDLDLTATQVTQAIWSLGKRKGLPIVQVTKGVWMYDPSRQEVVVAKSTSTLFELVGQSKQGKFVLQDESGDLYVAERL